MILESMRATRVPKKQTSKLYCGFLKNDTNIFAALSP
jgi:hypothetical protein